MEIREYVQRQIAAARRLVDAATKDLTDEQFNWSPPGTVNPIRAIFAHMATSEDFYIQTVLQGKPRLWESGGWGEKIGLSAPVGHGRWEEAIATRLDLGPVREYEAAVRSATEAYVATITPEELDRQVSFMGGQRPLADVLAMIVVHMLSHAGEIAALKGVQGVKGLPF